MIKKLLTICCVSLILFSCNSSEDKTQEQVIEQTTVDSAVVDTRADTALTIVTSPMIWTIDDNDPENEKLKKPEAKLDTVSSTNLVQLLNKSYPDVQMDLLKISHDTMYVKIPDSKKLTQQMGSTGAQNYLASATYTLTEHKNVKYVNFNMKEGDHAGPGVFSREDFKTMR
jgi:hypothetical protein